MEISWEMHGSPRDKLCLDSDWEDNDGDDDEDDGCTGRRWRRRRLIGVEEK